MALEEVNEISYGPVLITKGTYRGRSGFYNDDHNESTALVWLANHMAGIVTVDIRFLLPITGSAGKWVRGEFFAEKKLGRI